MKRISKGVMVAVGTVALLSSGARSRAQLVSSLTSGGGSGVVELVAGQFTLTQAATVSSAVLSLEDETSPGSGSLSDLTAILFQDNGNTVGMPLAPSTGASGTLSHSQYNPVTFTFGDPELSPGTYWIGLLPSSTSVLATGSLTNTGTDGTVNHLDYDGSYDPGAGLVFAINGTEGVSSTPEPGSIALLIGLSTVGMSVLRKRRCK